MILCCRLSPPPFSNAQNLSNNIYHIKQGYAERFLHMKVLKKYCLNFLLTATHRIQDLFAEKISSAVI